MPTQQTSISRRRRTLELYATAAIGAVIVGVSQSPVFGQSFNASGFALSCSSASIDNSVPGVTDVGIFADKTIISWGINTADGSTYAFQPAGTVAQFHRDDGQPYTVLNVINDYNGNFPAIRFAGQVNSYQGAVGGPIGGNIWFYNPGGIIVGATASFNVGSLLLSTLDPNPGGNNDFATGTDATITLRTDRNRYAGDNTSSIYIEPGATLTARNYIGLIAPQVVQSGTLNAGGAIGLVAAEGVDLDIRMDGGLFGISIPILPDSDGNPVVQGTSFSGGGTNPTLAAIVHTGSTGGAIAAAGTAPRKITMVAVPKNDAVTMLLGGTIGYGAASASVGTDGVLVLAGAGVSTDLDGGYVSSGASGSATTTGTIAIGGGTIVTPYEALPPPGTPRGTGALFSSALIADASVIDVQATGALARFDVGFTGATLLAGVTSSAVTVGAGRTLTASGGLTLSSVRIDESSFVRGGTTTLAIGAGGTLVADGAITVDASARVDVDRDLASSIGGTASLTVTDGTIRGSSGAAGAITVAADGIGVSTLGSGSLGAGTAAQATITGGLVRAASLTVSADGQGGAAASFFGGGNGGDAGGGTATLNASAGGTGAPTLDIAGAVTVSARAVGGSVAGSSGGDGGAAAGGTATLNVAAGTLNAATITVDARGTGGEGGEGSAPTEGYYDGGAGGTGQGGQATLTLAASLPATGAIAVLADAEGGAGGDARAYGGSGGSGNGGQGGTAIGGLAVTTLSGTVAADADGTLTISATRTGGRGGLSSATEATGDRQDGGAGGSARTIGTAGALLRIGGGAQVTRTAVTVTGAGRGGDGGASDFTAGGAGGPATGGTAGVETTGGGGTLTTTSLEITGSAIGGDGGGSGDGTITRGGDATAAAASFTATGLDLTAGTTAFASSAQGGIGAGPQGGIQGANGGAATTINAVQSTLGFGTLTIDTSANALDRTGQAQGQAGTGGAIGITAGTGAVVSATGDMTLTTSGFGGNGTGTAGAGVGGQVAISTTSGGSIAAGATTITTSGRGGALDSPGGGAGDGTGGAVTIAAAGPGAIDTAALTVTTAGIGGNGPVGGIGQSGAASLTASGGATLSATGRVTVATDATLGTSSTGSTRSGTQGGAILIQADGAQLRFDNGLTATSRSPSDTAGSITVTTIGDAATARPSTIASTTTLDATGITPGAIVVRNGIAGSATPLTFGTLAATSNGAGTDAVIQLVSVGNRIAATAVTLTADQGITIGSLNGGGVDVSGTFAANAGLFFTVNGFSNAVRAIDAGSIAINTYSYTSSANTVLRAADSIAITSGSGLTAPSLTAGNRITLNATGAIALGSATVTNAAVADSSGALGPAVSIVRATAGTSLTVTGTVAAPGTVALNGASVTVAGGALVTSGNRTTVAAGDDVTIADGATVAAGTAPLSPTSGALVVTAGDGSGPAGVHSLVNAGLVDAGASGLTVTADAVQTTGAGRLAGGAVTLSLNGTSATGNDGGRLLPDCVAGSLCVGPIAATGAIAIGQVGRTPDRLTFAGAVTGASLDARALAIALPPADITISGAARLTAQGGGDITTSNAGTLQAAAITLAASLIDTAPYRYVTTAGDLVLDGANTVLVGALVSTGRLGRNGDGAFTPGLDMTGRLTAGTLSVGTGGIDIAAAGGVTIGRLQITDGNPLRLDAGSAAVSLSDAGAGPGGRATTAVLQGGTVTVGRLATSGDVTLTASGGVASADDLLADGAVTARGTAVSLGSSGAMTVATLTATAGQAALQSAGALTLTNGTVRDALSLTSGTAGITVGTATAGGAVTVNAAGPITVSSLAGPTLAIATTGGGITADTLTATGLTTLSAPGAIAVTTLATGTVRASGGSVRIGSPGALRFEDLTGTSGDVIVTAATSLTVDGGQARGSATLTTGGALTAPTYRADGDLTLDGATLAAFDTLAGRNVGLRARAGGIDGRALTATGTTTLTARDDITVTALSSTDAVSASGRVLSLTAPVALTVASATGTTIALAGDAGITLGAGTSTGATTITAAGPVTVTTLDAGTVAIDARGGDLSAGRIASAGTSSLRAAGNLGVDALTSSGAVDASGGTVRIASPAALTFTTLTATSGGAAVTTDGALTVNGGTAAGNSSLVARGVLTVPSYTSTGDLILGGDTIAPLATIGARALSITAIAGGIAAGTLTATGTTTLSAAGAITVDALASTGAVTASGTTLSLAAPGALTVTTFTSSTGDTTLRARDALTATSGTSAGALTVVSSDGAVMGGTIGAAGATSLSASGPIAVTALSSGGAVDATGSAVTIGGAGDLVFASLVSTTGDLAVTTPGALSVRTARSAGAATLGAGGALALGTLTAGTDVALTGATLPRFDTLSARNLTLTVLSGDLSGGTLTASGTTELAASGAIVIDDLRSAGDVSLAARSASLTASTALSVSQATIGTGGLTLTSTGAGIGIATATVAGATSLSAPGAVSATSISSAGPITVVGDTIDLRAPGTLTIASARATGGDLSLISDGGAIAATGLSSGGAMRLAARDAVTVDGLVSAGDVQVGGDRVTITTPGALAIATLTAQRGFAVTAGGALRVGVATVQTPEAGSVNSLTSSGGDVTIGTVSLARTMGQVRQAAANGDTIARAPGDPAGLTIAAANTATLTDAIVTEGQVDMAATNLVINGTLDARGIALSSQTIAVGPAALIGTLSRTGTVAFVNSGTGRSTIGGAGTAAGYVLNAAALGRVQADAVRLTLPRATGSQSAPDVTVGALTLYGAGAAAPAGALQTLRSGTITIDTPGRVQVTSAVRLANLSPTNGLVIRADGIDVVTPTGSIIQTDAQGAPAGTLALDARTVRAASAGALADLGTLASPAEREVRLARNDGNLNETGWLSAGTIRIDYPAGATRTNGLATIYVQNSGGSAAADRRGVTTGSGGIVIAGFPTSDPPEVFINGRSRNGDATFATGQAFLASITQVGAGSAATDILVNGCVLTSVTCGQSLPPPTPDPLPTPDPTPPIPVPTQAQLAAFAPPQDLVSVVDNATQEDQDEATNKPGDPVPARSGNSLIQFAPTDTDSQPGSTGEQVIGAGNDSLWIGGAPATGTGGAASFDATIGVGGEATTGPAQRDGTAPIQQSTDRSPGGDRTYDGPLGIGADPGPSPPSGGRGGRGATGRPDGRAGVPDTSGVGVGSERTADEPAGRKAKRGGR